MSILLGAIGDDITGSTDLALMLGKNGMPAIQYIGVPQESTPDPGTPAAVVALKSRTAPPEEAVAQSVAACRWLVGHGARQIFFKYCSTFDSTEKGNIGPVAEALLDDLGAAITIVCPAFPANGRTIYQGHLFIGDLLLSDSGMRHHPLTPMTDPNLVRFLGRQVRSADAVGLVPWPVVRLGSAAIRERLQQISIQGRRFAVIDALCDRDLLDIGEACAELKLITGGSGVAMGLPANFRKAGLLPKTDGPAKIPSIQGAAAVLAGSCSAATRKQVHRMAQTHPAFRIDPLDLQDGRPVADRAVAWAVAAMQNGPILIFSTDDPEAVARAQARFGPERTGKIVENALAEIARRLHQAGVKKWIVAGGETSGAVVEALGIHSLRIGPEIEPGVPWTFSPAPEALCLAFKSGNFGTERFFEKALGMLPGKT
jgi:uncharacterized protein YgbK (DUF1537 family)